MSNCGCRVHEAVDTPSVQRPAFITYCRTHADAPDLLAALESIEQRHGNCGGECNDDILSIVRDATAKVTGAEVGT